MQKIKDPFPIRGIFEMTVKRNGIVIERYRDKNLIVNGARNQAARLFAGDSVNRAIAKIAFGTNGTDPVIGDTAITNAFVKDVVGFEFPDMGQIQTNWLLNTDENNGMAIIEFGLLSVDGTLLCRKVRTKPINKEADISIEGSWTWIF
ncbi:hypothetical protein GWP43_13560 [Treponema vincentii]|uniref:Uncharacterized protein n=1 Tax=Treponema vincentii TaxID=69710 RepID=A0A6P1Y3A7_9SPIR|nr:hypothetical protein [Treponema vincentii]QHX44317.1 hypothetical protein GWP43_13560 [Treponema vincentii]